MPAVVTLVVLGLTLAPTGFYQFCIDQPRQCAVVAGSALPTVAAADAVNRAGVASSAVRVAAGWADNGERHAVLVVTTSTGDLVLDNRTNELLPVGRARVRIDKIQSASNPRIWQVVED